MAEKKQVLRLLGLSFLRRVRLWQTFFQITKNYTTKRLAKEADSALCAKSLRSRVTELLTIDKDNINYISDGEKESIISLANKALNNEFNYLSSGWVHLDPIAWDCDFKSGFRWMAGIFYKKYKQVDINNTADVKVPRELSRCHFLLHLSVAYRLTGEDKYAGKVYEIICNWIENNPFLYSINWCCAMDVGIRAINWIWAMSLLKGYEVSEDLSKRITSSLMQHGWFIYNNLEGDIFRYNNNHYYSDLVGLFHIGLLFKDTKRGGLWADFAYKEICRETRLQILPGGMSYELTTSYTRLMLELLIPSLVLMKRNGLSVPTDIESRLESIFEWVLCIIQPDGRFPIIGDQDNGRVLPFGGEDINDMSYLPSLGTVLFKRKDLGWHGSSYNVYCAIFGGKDDNKICVEGSRHEFEEKSIYLRDCGLAVMRNAANYLSFNTNNEGLYLEIAHANTHVHSDRLSFTLMCESIPFIVDPGTYVYSADCKARYEFRQTRKHNTIEVDGRDQSIIKMESLWDLIKVGRSELLRWESTAQYDEAEAMHTAYDNIDYGVVHYRSIRFDKLKPKWTISDKLTGTGCHSFVARFHLHSKVSVSVIADKKVLLKAGDVAMMMSFESSQESSVSLQESAISEGYGNIQPSWMVVVEAKCDCPYELVTTIVKQLSL